MTDTTNTLWPEPTDSAPDQEQIAEWATDSIVDATDGCSVEPDGVCEHGHPSWLRSSLGRSKGLPGKGC